MSPSCTIKSKQSLDQTKSKSKCFKDNQKPRIKDSMATKEMKKENDESVYIDLDLQCCCPQSKLNNNASIQFSRRYLQCQSSMPVAILRSYIQLILPHSSMTQVTFYDSQHRLLHDQQLLSSLQQPPPSCSSSSSSSSSPSIHIPIRFSLFNTITSLAHCSCSSSIPTPTQPLSTSSSSSPTVIRRETIDQTLSTCSSLHHPSSMIYSPCLSSSASVSSPPASISIVNLLTPPPSSSSCHSSTVNENNSVGAAVAGAITDQAMIDEITSQFGEICPPVVKKNRNRLSKKMSSNVPLDLSMKKRPSPSFDMFASQPKWIKT